LRHLYSLLLYLLVPFVLVRLLWRSLKLPAYRHRWGERFGFIAPLPADGVVWVHAVSVGEAQAAFPLIDWLRREKGLPVLVTTTTPTGSARVRQRFGDDVFHVYLPYDLPGAVLRFLARVRPRLAVIMETELWLNLFHHCRRRGIPVVVANARLSGRSARRYRRFAALSRATLREVSLIAAQTQADAERFIGLGMTPARIRVTGNIKFDLKLTAALHAQAGQLRNSWHHRQVWIAASTHAGEEEAVLSAHAMVLTRLPRALLIWVPRHPERFDKVAELCRRRGYLVARRSAGEAVTEPVTIYLADTLGELPLFYAAAEVAFVGGSLVESGGHNVLEPAALGLPVMVGPHTFNFLEIVRALLGQGGGERVMNETQLATAVVRYLEDDKLRDAAGACGRELVERNRGALGKLQALLSAYLSEAEEPEKRKEES
jgi:3-deoxy-D-manno-octulosonic-acid transferase